MLQRLPTLAFDSSSDAFEIGLMAAASPEFAAAMVQRLIALTSGESPTPAAVAGIERLFALTIGELPAPPVAT